VDGDGRDINLSFSPTAGEVRVAANVALRYSGLVWALVALMVFEFLVVGVWGHSVVWGVVFTVFFGLVEIAAWSWAIGARNRTLKQWTRIQLTTEELRITRAETDFHFKWSQFRKWVRREGVYALLGKSRAPVMFVVIPGRACSSADEQARLEATLVHNVLETR